MALMTIVFVFSLLLYALLRLGEYAYVELRRKGKARIVWLDHDSGELRIDFHERNGNEVTLGTGERAKRYLLDGRARYPGRYPTWLVNARHGWNFVAPSDEQTVEKDSILQVLAISNPATYHNAIHRNKARDALRANDESDRWGWVLPVAIVAGVALLATLGIVGWIAVQLGKGAAGA